MLRFIAVAGFVLSVATSAQGMTPAPLAPPDGMVSKLPSGVARAGPESTAYVSHARPYGTRAAPSADARDGGVVSALCMSEARGRPL